MSLTAAAGAFLLVCAACGDRGGRHAETPLPQIDVAYPVEDSVVLRKTYPGYLIASLEVDLVARVDGYLESAPYEPGAYVKKGTVLFTIEDKNYRDAVERAEAALATARSTYAYNSTRYEAMKKALEGDAVSEMEVAQAKSALEESEAAIKTAEAELQTARTQLSYCTVRAPFDGRVSTNSLDVGSYLAGAGAPVTLARIYDDKTMLANIAVEDATYLDLSRRNSGVTGADYSRIPVEFSDTLSHSYTCDLSYMAPQMDKSTGTMRLQAGIDNPYGELRSGMYVTVALPYGVEPRAIMVREASLGSDQLGKYVYVVNDSNRVVYTPVKTGELVGDSLRIITQGISRDDRYVTKALLKVRDGKEVNPVESGKRH